MEQKEFNAPEIINANEPHMALTFLIDRSGSMAGDPIKELNEGLARFKEDVCKDDVTKRVLDVSIISFSDNGNCTVDQNFVPVEKMEAPVYQAGGQTYLAEPLSKAIEMISERSRLYRRTGAEPYKPWIVFITDGFPMDNNLDQLVNQVKELTDKNKLAFWSLGVKGADFDFLHKISGKRVIELLDYDFTKFFDWVQKSMRSVSSSAPGTTPKGVDLPENAPLHNTDHLQ